MIQKTELFCTICEKCKKQNAEKVTGFVYSFSEEESDRIARENGWVEINGKHYCDECKNKTKTN